MTTTLSSEVPAIETTRIFKAPRHLVFAAFSEQKHINSWWGPNGFTNETHEWNFKPGGKWSYTMHHPVHGKFLNLISYLDIIEDELISYIHGESVEDPEQFRTVIKFADHNEGTEITMTMTFPDFDSRDEVVEKYGAIQGQKETLDKLENFLKGQS